MIREAVPADVPTLVELVKELAEYEHEAGQVQLTAEKLSESLFCLDPKVFALVAELDGEVVGAAIWFINFSTWTGRHGIFLEDLFVRPHARKKGLGLALLAELASIAQRSGYARIDWEVLDWNEPSIAFYRSLGAEHMDTWHPYRLQGEALAALAGAGGAV